MQCSVLPGDAQNTFQAVHVHVIDCYYGVHYYQVIIILHYYQYVLMCPHLPCYGGITLSPSIIIIIIIKLTNISPTAPALVILTVQSFFVSYLSHQRH